jgi:hypothetical protein
MMSCRRLMFCLFRLRSFYLLLHLTFFSRIE